MEPDQLQPKLKANSSIFDIAKLYSWQIILTLISIVIILSVILPFAQQLTDYFGQISDYTSKYNTLVQQQQREQLLAAVTNAQEASLAKIDKLIPQSQTAVVSFSESISKKATDNGLTLTDSVVGEIVIVSQNSQSASKPSNNGGLQLVELPAEFKLTGQFSSIRSFLSKLFGGSDFIIIQKMDLQKSPAPALVKSDSSNNIILKNQNIYSSSSVDNWSMTIDLVKYQFRATNGDLTKLKNAYFQVPDNSRPSQAVLDFIDKNYN